MSELDSLRDMLEDELDTFRERKDPNDAHDHKLIRIFATVVDAIDSVQGDIAALKVVVPPPKGFESWEQFDKVTNLAAQSFNANSESVESARATRGQR